MERNDAKYSELFNNFINEVKKENKNDNKNYNYNYKKENLNITNKKDDEDINDKEKEIKAQLLQFENRMLIEKLEQKENILKDYKKKYKDQKQKIAELQQKIKEIMNKEKEKERERELKREREIKREIEGESHINAFFEDKSLEQQIIDKIKNISSLQCQKDSILSGIETIKFDIDNTPFYQCGICMDSFQDKEEIKRLTCGHIYHKECLKQWIQGNEFCYFCGKFIYK